jgi:hypothetical protein
MARVDVLCQLLRTISDERFQEIEGRHRKATTKEIAYRRRSSHGRLIKRTLKRDQPK